MAVGRGVYEEKDVYHYCRLLKVILCIRWAAKKNSELFYAVIQITIRATIGLKIQKNSRDLNIFEEILEKNESLQGICSKIEWI